MLFCFSDFDTADARERIKTLVESEGLATLSVNKVTCRNAALQVAAAVLRGSSQLSCVVVRMRRLTR